MSRCLTHACNTQVVVQPFPWSQPEDSLQPHDLLDVHRNNEHSEPRAGPCTNLLQNRKQGRRHRTLTIFPTPLYSPSHVACMTSRISAISHCRAAGWYQAVSEKAPRPPNLLPTATFHATSISFPHFTRAFTSTSLSHLYTITPISSSPDLYAIFSRSVHSSSRSPLAADQMAPPEASRWTSRWSFDAQRPAAAEPKQPAGRSEASPSAAAAQPNARASAVPCAVAHHHAATIYRASDLEDQYGGVFFGPVCDSECFLGGGVAWVGR